MKIKINDKVQVTCGKDRGKSGKVIQIFAREKRVVVEGANLMKKHARAKRRGDKGQIIELAAPLSLVNVALLCPRCGRAVKVGYRIEGGQKKRFCRKCRELID